MSCSSFGELLEKVHFQLFVAVKRVFRSGTLFVWSAFVLFRAIDMLQRRISSTMTTLAFGPQLCLHIQHAVWVARAFPYYYALRVVSSLVTS
jgi:hypothetical protein